MQCLSFRDKFVTESGQHRLDQQIADWTKRLKRLQSESSDRQARDSGSTGGGMRMQDAATCEHESNRRLIDRLTLIRKQAQLVPVPIVLTHLRIGLPGVFEYRARVHGKPRRVQRIVEIAGYEDSDCDSVPRRVSYELPFAIAFLGATPGTKELVQLDGKVRQVKLLRILKPS
jgi:transcription elongation GreA/GreB family factor